MREARVGGKYSSSLKWQFQRRKRLISSEDLFFLYPSRYYRNNYLSELRRFIPIFLADTDLTVIYALGYLERHYHLKQ